MVDERYTYHATRQVETHEVTIGKRRTFILHLHLRDDYVATGYAMQRDNIDTFSVNWIHDNQMFSGDYHIIDNLFN